MKNLIVKTIVLGLIYGMSIVQVYSQPVLSAELEYKIMCSVQKNVSMSLLFNRMAMYKRQDRENSISPWYFLSFPGFGFVPGELDFQVTKSDLKYPDENWQLYELIFSDTPHNDSLYQWSAGVGYIYHLKKVLFGVNEKEEIKFVSGAPFSHPMAKDFNLQKDSPDTYLPFLYLKLFSFQFDFIEFSGMEKDELVFIGSSNGDGVQKLKLKIFINPEDPDKQGNINIKFIEQPKPAPSRPFLNLKFKNLEDKKRYLLNVLMKNIYMYRIMHLPDLEERLNVNPSARLFKEGHSELDSLLPNYDQYWYDINWVTFNLTYANGNCPNVWKDFQGSLLTDKGRNVVGNIMFDGLEFYRFYKDTVEVLPHRSGKYNSSMSSWEANHYYQTHPEERKKRDELVQKGYPPPPPPPSEHMPEILKFGGNPKCLPYNLPFSEKWQRRMDYYLLALDTETREVYFISGKNIYLTKAAHLYPPVNKELPASIKDWANPYKLEYIKDRLYSYQVPIVAEENIVAQDEEKMILEVTGMEYGKEIKLRVTFNIAAPEELEIENITK